MAHLYRRKGTGIRADSNHMCHSRMLFIAQLSYRLCSENEFLLLGHFWVASDRNLPQTEDRDLHCHLTGLSAVRACGCRAPRKTPQAALSAGYLYHTVPSRLLQQEDLLKVSEGPLGLQSCLVGWKGGLHQVHRRPSCRNSSSGRPSACKVASGNRVPREQRPPILGP